MTWFLGPGWATYARLTLATRAVSHETRELLQRLGASHLDAIHATEAEHVQAGILELRLTGAGSTDRSAKNRLGSGSRSRESSTESGRTKRLGRSFYREFLLARNWRAVT